MSAFARSFCELSYELCRKLFREFVCEFFCEFVYQLLSDFMWDSFASFVWVLLWTMLRVRLWIHFWVRLWVLLWVPLFPPTHTTHNLLSRLRGCMDLHVYVYICMYISHDFFKKRTFSLIITRALRVCAHSRENISEIVRRSARSQAKHVQHDLFL